MPMHFSTEIVFENKSDYRRACEFIKPLLKELHTKPGCDDNKLSISFGRLGGAFEQWFLEIPQKVAVAFPNAPFRVDSWTDLGEHWWGRNIDGTVTLVDHYEEIVEMLWRWHIDVEDPFAGPTEENWAELRRCREQHIQEMIDLGVDISPGTWPPTEEQEEKFEQLKHPDLHPDYDPDEPIELPF